MQHDPLKLEIDRNFDAFQRGLSRFLPEEAGRYALLRHGRVVSFHDRAGEADGEGAHRYEDGLYSIQLVTDSPLEMGLYAEALR